MLYYFEDRSTWIVDMKCEKNKNLQLIWICFCCHYIIHEHFVNGSTRIRLKYSKILQRSEKRSLCFFGSNNTSFYGKRRVAQVFIAKWFFCRWLCIDNVTYEQANTESNPNIFHICNETRCLKFKVYAFTVLLKHGSVSVC